MAAPTDIRVSLLGGFSVVVAGQRVEDHWRLRKAKTLVKLLALTPGHRLHREILVDILWPEAEAQIAASNLHQVLHIVRRMLGAPAVTLVGDVVQLCPAGGLQVDVDAFERAAADAHSDTQIAALRRALELWTGPLLPDDLYADWAAEHRHRLTETHAALATLLGSKLRDEGEPEAALAVLEPLAPERSLDEQFHRVLIDVLAELGRRWEAIQTYERLRDALDEAYAAEPEPQTRAIYRRLLTGGKPMPATVLHNLRGSATSFVGRRRLLNELLASLGRTRLLSLTGVGGVGKSRLALELARLAGATPNFPDGVWLVELAGIRDDDGVESTTASALRLTLPVGLTPSLGIAEQLSTRTLLLILDNCEHLLDACCALIDEILARCPDISILATTREPLGYPGELVYRVPSLELPPAGTGIDVGELARLEAVQLFVERAGLNAPSFRLDTKTAGPVAEICRRLDGIPLALELAAARLAHFTVDELIEGLGDALTLLGHGRRGRLDRQQTLGATLDWSHGLLEGKEPAIFRRLAVFAGGFDLNAAASVCESPGPLVSGVLSRLVDKSLVQADTAESTTRYRLLEVVRQYAETRLSEAAELSATRARHLQWYAAAAAARDPDRGGAVVGEPSSWFDVEQDNLRAALTTALAVDPWLALQLATATWRFWVNRGLINDGARLLALALDACQDRSALRARALSAMAVLRIRQARTKELTAIGDEIVDLLDDHGEPGEGAHARHQRALLTFMSGDWRLAQVQIDEALNLAGPFPPVVASAQHFAGILALWRGEMDTARARFHEALLALDRVPDETVPFFIAVAPGWAVDERGDTPLPFGEETVLGRRVGAQQAVGHVRLAIALIDRLSGRVSAALTVIGEASAQFRRVDDRYGEAYALAQQGHTLRWAGQYQEADRCLLRSESLRRNLRDRRAVALALSGRALTAASAGGSDKARTLGRQALVMMERSSDTPGVMVTTVNLAVVELLSSDLPAALIWLDRSLRFFPVPGAQGAQGWLYLLRAHLLRQVGDLDGSATSAGAAQTVFAQLHEGRGLAAVQRICKAGLNSFHT